MELAVGGKGTLAGGVEGAVEGLAFEVAGDTRDDLADLESETVGLGDAEVGLGGDRIDEGDAVVGVALLPGRRPSTGRRRPTRRAAARSTTCRTGG